MCQPPMTMSPAWLSFIKAAMRPEALASLTTSSPGQKRGGQVEPPATVYRALPQVLEAPR